MLLTCKQYNSSDVIKISFKVDSCLVIVYTMVVVLIAILPTSILAMVIAQFMDAVDDVVNGQKMMSALYGPVFNLLCVLGVSSLLEPLAQLIESKIQLKLESVLLPQLVEKQAKLPYRYIEDASSWELVERMTDEMTQTFMEGIQGYRIILQSLLTIVSVAALLFNYIWWGALYLILTSIPLVMLSIYWAKKHYQAKVDTQQYERSYSYYSDNVLTNRESVAERELFSYSEHMIERYDSLFCKARDIQLRVLLKSCVSMKLTEIMLIILILFILFPVVDAFVNHRITLGTFTGIVTALFYFAEHLGKNLQTAVKYIAEAQEYMQELTFLMSLEDVEGAIDLPAELPFSFSSLEFIDVWFKYPHTDTYLLQGISFKILAGEHCAFVGKNGAGKTTITKLLTGLYDTYEGQILVNGIELRNYAHSTLKSIFSVIYQDFAKYELTLQDNIHLGAIQHELDPHRLSVSLAQSDLANLAASLPNGVKTTVGKLFETSQDLSGGQWQRVAIARSIYSTAPFKILDEPTAALDPLSESKLYQQFSDLMSHKTSLLITHRLGAVKLVDRIFVMDDGRIVESGGHHELLALNGLYAQMYQLQEVWYREK